MEGLQTNINSITLKTKISMGPPEGQFRPPGGPSLKMTNISNQMINFILFYNFFTIFGKPTL